MAMPRATPAHAMREALGCLRKLSQEKIANNAPKAAPISVVTNLPCARMLGEKLKRMRAAIPKKFPPSRRAYMNRSAPRASVSKIMGNRDQKMISFGLFPE
ncbi:MAG: hypothetical protein A3E07_02410 [Candidatus Wildermuthbacteria bacterium RIFCSPHIGHO2_12_FULL_45_9]|nr:MAG: hypothetical protein A3E07_02410 [Candidatus Wildermuthbacteria bacterium RIFCSPHIGHO2_12_FULL_45_9]